MPGGTNPPAQTERHTMPTSTAQNRVLDILAAGPVNYSATATVRRCRFSRRPVCKGLASYTATQDGAKVKGFSILAASALLREGVIVMVETIEGVDTFDAKKLGSSYSRSLNFQMA